MAGTVEDEEGFRKDKRFRLEDILNQKVSENTDVMDFLFIDGWGYNRHPLLRISDEERQHGINDEWGERYSLMRNWMRRKKKSLSVSERNTKGRFYSCCVPEMGYGKSFTVIGGLKAVMENEALVYKHVGYKTLSYLNKAFEKYGIKPFKVGKGDRKYESWELRKLRENGLEPADKNL